MEPTLCSLREWLQEPDAPQRFRVDGLLPACGRAIVAAQFKGGKTTLVSNLVRSLVDGERFLGAHTVTRVDGAVALLDMEMSSVQLKDWMRMQRIVRDDRVMVESLRGRVPSFNLLDPAVRRTWASRLRQCGVEFLILDCLRPVLDALGLEEKTDAGRFLVHFDQLLNDAGIREAVVVQHMGHVGERSRGDSRLRDWPDVEWTLVRQDEKPNSPRFFSAYGRDVDVPETRLAYDAATRRLTVVGGTRKDAKQLGALDAIVTLLQQEPNQSGRAIKAALEGSMHGRDAVDAALAAGVKAGALAAKNGARNAKLYRAVSECPAVSGEVSGGRSTESVSECPTASIEADTSDAPKQEWRKRE